MKSVININLSPGNASICRPVSNPASLRDCTWSSRTCVLSFDTIGVWPETVDGSDLNACARSHDGKLVATGDDFGKIKLYTHPAVQPKVRTVVFDPLCVAFKSNQSTF